MDFRQVGRAIRTNLLVALAVLFLFIVIGGADAYLPAKKYQASTILLAEPNQAIDPASAVAAIQFFLPQLAIESQDPSVLAKVAAKVPSKYARIPVSITAAANPQTGTLTVNATSTNPDAAAAFVNADAHVLIGLQKNNRAYALLEPSQATIPTKPSNPRKAVLFGAITFGIIAAIFAALGADAIRRRLSKVEETRSAAGLSVLAEVPRVRRHALLPAQVFGTNADSLILEAFQELRSNLLLALPTDRPATIAVTSGDSGEGKSSVAADLAWALASEQRPVTAVDCDLRKPTMHLLLGNAVGPGVSGCRSLELDSLLSPTINPYLNFIPAGIPNRHPVDIVSAYVPSLLGELREEGRHVIVDCPPLNGVAETLLLASLADVVVLVVDVRHFDPAHVQQHQARLQDAGATVIGVVLNRVWIGAKRRKRHYDYGTVIERDFHSSVIPVAPHTPVSPKIRLPRSG
jgi:Mrp family chromosome partitioning ATPase